MTHTPKATGAILDFAAAPHVLPPAVRADALRLLGDTLAVMAAGAASDEAAQVRAACNDPAFHAAFAIHCLEWDAVHEGAVVHALSVATAALLASSHRAGGCDPEEFLTALAVGVDIASGLGIAATGPMRFFRPATAGVIGAALAVARLEGLTRDQMADVLGLAYSFAGGTMQAHAEASIALPLQIGRAAQAAIQAADMGKAGLTGPHNAIEGPFGYSALIEPLDLSRYTPGAPWRISEVSIKPFPCGRASHGALGALQDLALPLDDVDSIELFAPPLIQRLVGRPYRPDAPMSYNRLCLAFLAPLMLRDGRINPRQNESIPELAERVTVSLDGNPDANALSPQRLVVKLKNGNVIERQIDANLGSPDAPMAPEQYAAKYALCRELAPHADPRLFDDPLAYATDPK
ncbi:MAG: MmgE/PrpD family protein [Sphingopyxis sp.]|nr:MmgE/PrpD family protein [Sphingopyxis sp.]